MKKHAVWLVALALILSTAVALAAGEAAIGHASPDGLGSITTAFNSDNQFAGNMFDIENIGTDPITITSFDINLLTGGTGALISVYSVPGTYVGNETNPAPWTLMGTDTVDSAGTDVPTPVAIGGLTINPGETYGLYVTVTNYPAGTMRYTNGSLTVANTEVELTLGAGKGNPDFTGSTFSPRYWNGTIYYDIVSGPAIVIDKSPDWQAVAGGGSADFTITITNTGTVTLTDVTVTDAAAPGCDASVGEMAAGTATSYACSDVAVTGSYTNTAVVTSMVNNEPGPTDSDDAYVEYVDAVLDIEKTPDYQEIVEGGNATFTITVTNTGSLQIDAVAVTDALVPACDNVIGVMAVGDSSSWTCTDIGVAASYTNTAVVTGVVDFQGALQVLDSDDAFVQVNEPTSVSLSGFGQEPAALSPLWLAALLVAIVGFGALLRRRLAD